MIVGPYLDDHMLAASGVCLADTQAGVSGYNSSVGLKFFMWLCGPICYLDCLWKMTCCLMTCPTCKLQNGNRAWPQIYTKSPPVVWNCALCLDPDATCKSYGGAYEHGTMIIMLHLLVT